jgi:DNA-binding NarL/FixJ family response regulator
MPHTIKSRPPFVFGTDRHVGFADDEVLSGLRVLIADPYPQLREIMRDILLRGIGVDEVIEAKNGEEVLALLSKLACDVAIIDCAMAPLGGVELTKRIRKGVEGIDPFLPVILVSGRADVAEIIAARDVGANEYLAKPLSAKILDLRLNSVIKRPRPFVRTDNFFGPDRRRHAKDGFGGSERRNHEVDAIDLNK